MYLKHYSSWPLKTPKHFHPKVQCCHCGVNCDLLINRFKVVICRECLDKEEFEEEVESELQDYTSEEESVASAYYEDLHSRNDNKERCDENNRNEGE